MSYCLQKSCKKFFVVKIPVLERNVFQLKVPRIQLNRMLHGMPWIQLKPRGTKGLFKVCGYLHVKRNLTEGSPSAFTATCPTPHLYTAHSSAAQPYCELLIPLQNATWFRATGPGSRCCNIATWAGLKEDLAPWLTDVTAQTYFV